MDFDFSEIDLNAFRYLYIDPPEPLDRMNLTADRLAHLKKMCACTTALEASDCRSLGLPEGATFGDAASKMLSVLGIPEYDTSFSNIDKHAFLYSTWAGEGYPPWELREAEIAHIRAMRACTDPLPDLTGLPMGPGATFADAARFVLSLVNSPDPD